VNRELEPRGLEEHTYEQGDPAEGDLEGEVGGSHEPRNGKDATEAGRKAQRV
jgi:hypothetical protein